MLARKEAPKEHLWVTSYFFCQFVLCNCPTTFVSVFSFIGWGAYCFTLSLVSSLSVKTLTTDHINIDHFVTLNLTGWLLWVLEGHGCFSKLIYLLQWISAIELVFVTHLGFKDFLLVLCQRSRKFVVFLAQPLDMVTGHSGRKLDTEFRTHLAEHYQLFDNMSTLCELSDISVLALCKEHLFRHSGKCRIQEHCWNSSFFYIWKW